MNNLEKIALGGGCHWCTEAVFLSLKGVEEVNQGFVASTGENTAFSEAVIVIFNPGIIRLNALIHIHLLTHKSTSDHSMRSKYRSAIYTFNKEQKLRVGTIINSFQSRFNNQIITKVIDFVSFKPSQEQFINYYYKNPQKPFCQKFVEPKLKLLLEQFSENTNENKLNK